MLKMSRNPGVMRRLKRCMSIVIKLHKIQRGEDPAVLADRGDSKVAHRQWQTAGHTDRRCRQHEVIKLVYMSRLFVTSFFPTVC